MTASKVTWSEDSAISPAAHSWRLASISLQLATLPGPCTSRQRPHLPDPQLLPTSCQQSNISSHLRLAPQPTLIHNTSQRCGARAEPARNPRRLLLCCL